MQSQLIRAKTKSGSSLYIAICADDDQKIFVLMSVTAFTAGTYFESADKALRECLDVINQLVGYRNSGDMVGWLHSDPDGTFLTNNQMTAILFSNHPEREEE